MAMAGGLVLLTGCQTLKSKFSALPKLPSAEKLAFWKSEDAALPPPPARHFDPAPSDAMSGNERAMLARDDVRASEVDLDAVREKINNKYDSAMGSLASQNGKPLRNPYAMEDAKPSGSTSGFAGSGNAGLGNAGSGNAGSGNFAKADQKLSQAQNQFNAALGGVKDASSSFKSSSDSLAASANEGFKGLSNSAKSGFDNSMAQVNNALYDSKGNLTTGVSDANAFANSALKSTEKSARDHFNDAIGSVASGAKEAANSSTEFAGSLKNKIASATGGFKPPAFNAAAAQSGGNAFKPVGFGAAVSKVSEKVTEKANGFLAGAAKGARELNSGFDFPSGAPGLGKSTAANDANSIAGPAAGTNGQIAQNATQNIPSSGNSFKPPAATSGFGVPRTAQVTPVGSRSPDNSMLSPRGINTSIGNTFDRQAGQAGQVGFQRQLAKTTPAGSNGFKPAATSTATSPFPSPIGERGSRIASIPSEFSTGQNAMTSHVSDVDIPANILSGSGSYAPGSVGSVIR